jgi:hypothetical protein
VRIRGVKLSRLATIKRIKLKLSAYYRVKFMIDLIYNMIGRVIWRIYSVK